MTSHKGPIPPKPADTDEVRWVRVVHGVRGKCVACEQKRWLHPELEMCGTCTFGSWKDQDEFQGAWWEGEILNEKVSA